MDLTECVSKHFYVYTDYEVGGGWESSGSTPWLPQGDLPADDPVLVCI